MFVQKKRKGKERKRRKKALMASGATDEGPGKRGFVRSNV